MLVRVGLEVGEGAVHRRPEERRAADGVVERRHAVGVDLREERDVRRLVEELGLREGQRARVAADDEISALAVPVSTTARTEIATITSTSETPSSSCRP